MRTVQLMKKMSDASKNIFRVYHIRIIAQKKWFTRHETRQIPQSAIIGTKQPKVNQSPQRKGEDDKHAHVFADF